MQIAEFLNTINLVGSKFRVEKNPGIPLNKLKEVEKKLNIVLPPELVEFYTYSNGLQGDDFIFNIIPLEDVVKETDEIGQYLVFAEYLIYSETCALEIDPHDPTKYRFFYTWRTNSEGEIERNYFADSIFDFITLYSKKGTFGIFNSEGEENEIENTGLENNELGSVETNDNYLPDVKKKWWKFW